MSLIDGTTYSGDMKDGKLTGTAQIKYSNGDQYNGSMENGQKSGEGTYKWASGSSYTGSLVKRSDEWKRNVSVFRKRDRL